MKKTSAIVLTTALLASTAALAQNADRPTTPPPMGSSPSAPIERAPSTTPPSTTMPSTTAPSTAMPSTTHSAPTWAANKTVGEVVGQGVYTASGDRIGEVDEVVQAKSGDGPLAVIGVGGFLGIGERKVALPLGQIVMNDDKLVAPGLTKDTAKSFPEYHSAEYTKLERSAKF